ncbi:GNAT family N-acetyltransferase [Acidothermaceae bacterium B102]|nr:GNAT family N-acetyltransferase [Acidothermaceae bacterium B102]
MTEPVARVAGADDLDRVVEILTGAFFTDPTWSWAFPDPERRPAQLAALWRLLVEGAARYPSVWLNADATATAVWIPPGGTELSVEQDERVAPLLVDLLGADDAPRVLRMMEGFAEHHPHNAEHYYLTLLGTDPAHRGKGLGLQLLEDTLALADEDGVGAYLEASNPVNVALYARYGFRPHSSFVVSPDVAPVTTMWRDPRTGT